MRQSQKNNRTRSRGRKPSNPLSRSYDSNGPDVKIRGTASHIAEKYQSLARDASASGDIVMAENYYQHAEHYLRIIAAAQASSREEGRQMNGSGEQPSVERGSRKGPSSMVEITGDEPQPDIDGFGDTAMEMEVAVIPDSDSDDDSSDASGSENEDEGEAKAAAPQRRRRRTTYRSRKRTAGADGGDESASGTEADAPKAVAAEE